MLMALLPAVSLPYLGNLRMPTCAARSNVRDRPTPLADSKPWNVKGDQFQRCFLLASMIGRASRSPAIIWGVLDMPVQEEDAVHLLLGHLL